MNRNGILVIVDDKHREKRALFRCLRRAYYGSGSDPIKPTRSCSNGIRIRSRS